MKSKLQVTESVTLPFRWDLCVLCSCCFSQRSCWEQWGKWVVWIMTNESRCACAYLQCHSFLVLMTSVTVHQISMDFISTLKGCQRQWIITWSQVSSVSVALWSRTSPDNTLAKAAFLLSIEVFYSTTPLQITFPLLSDLLKSSQYKHITDKHNPTHEKTRKQLKICPVCKTIEKIKGCFPTWLYSGVLHREIIGNRDGREQRTGRGWGRCRKGRGVNWPREDEGERRGRGPLMRIKRVGNNGGESGTGGIWCESPKRPSEPPSIAACVWEEALINSLI